MSVHEKSEIVKFLSKMDEEQLKRFTPSELVVQLDVRSLKSIFSSQPKLVLLSNQHPPYPYLMDIIPYSPSKWLQYVYRTAHPVLHWLPTKLAEWIGENLQDELGFPDKADQGAEPGSGWTPAELNHILQAHVVDGALSTFGCVEWESELCRGVMRARCHPFDMPKHIFY